MSIIVVVDDSNWESFVRSNLAVLVLTQNSCPHCEKWIQELTDFLGRGEDWTHVSFGKIILDGLDGPDGHDGPGVERFKASNGWLDSVDWLPFNVVYRSGERVSSFPGPGIERLAKRLKNAMEGLHERHDP